MSKILATPTSETLTRETLPLAIGHLLELNNYSVQYSVKIHGAEVDIVATPKSDPFQSKIFIEATIQYVDNTKYGKDLTKFSLIRSIDQTALCLSVSASGFTNDVMERASVSKIQTITYDELFRKFERVADYIDHVIDNKASKELASSYEPPRLLDATGNHDALTWFNDWQKNGLGQNWIVLLGEYGTGKTALTMYLQRMWLEVYKSDPLRRIPIRIELRNFTRQFDANSLLHHFLDSNFLSHIPLEYLRHLIRAGRIIIILDGYDEMAQFMNARERRICLSALASLANDGAIGILTSRPNYFTEDEELNVFEALYVSMEKSKYFFGESDRNALDQERAIDSLLERYVLNRKERYLRDLDSLQTESLVRRKLKDDPDGQSVVLRILSKVFRNESDGHRQSLSGKPVIVSFLLELIDELKGSDVYNSDLQLTEWVIYKMIVDRLMLRDFRRAPSVLPDQRRSALQRLAIKLSQRDNPAASEDDFVVIIDDVFKSQLRRLHGEERRARRDELFQDLRSSSTLTRQEIRGSMPRGDFWQFSHNSIREYLVAESIVSAISSGSLFKISVSISDTMRQFVASMSSDEIDRLIRQMQSMWPHRDSVSAQNFITAMWDAMKIRSGGLLMSLEEISGSGSATADLSFLSLNRLDISHHLSERYILKLKMESSNITSCEISNLSLSGSTFNSAILDTVSFKNVDLKGADFRGAYLFECIFENVSVSGSDFRGLETGSNFSVRRVDGSIIVLAEEAAIGFLKYCGALTDSVDTYYIAMHHPQFAIIEKICKNISDQRKSQLRGLTQRGVAQGDPAFARLFVSFMAARGLIEIDSHDLVSVTGVGRGAITRFLDHNEMLDGLAEFLKIE